MEEIEERQLRRVEEWSERGRKRALHALCHRGPLRSQAVAACLEALLWCRFEFTKQRMRKIRDQREVKGRLCWGRSGRGREGVRRRGERPRERLSWRALPSPSLPPPSLPPPAPNPAPAQTLLLLASSRRLVIEKMMKMRRRMKPIAVVWLSSFSSWLMSSSFE